MELTAKQIADFWKIVNSVEGSYIAAMQSIVDSTVAATKRKSPLR